MEEKGRPTRWRSRRRLVVLMVFVMVFCAAVLEGGSYVALRYVFHVPMAQGGDREIPTIWTRDGGALPFGIKKNHEEIYRSDEFDTVIRTNNVGIREESDYQGEHVDIGFVGDSMTFGWGVNVGERYSDVLREYLPDKHIRSYGYIDGLAPPHYYLFFKNHPEYIPDTIILGLYPANDLDIDMRDTRMAFDGRGEPIAASLVMRYVTDSGALGVGYDPTNVHPVFRPLVASYTGKLFWLGRQQLASTRNWSSVAEQQGGEGARGKLGAPHRASLAYLTRLRSLVGERGARVIVFLMPPRAQFTGHPFPLWEPVKDWLRENQFELIDPVEAFAQVEHGGGQLYYPKDTHWNAKGHRLAAQLLAKYLEEER